jgi:hypothetical protein
VEKTSVLEWNRAGWEVCGEAADADEAVQGSYGLRSESINLHGQLELSAKLSHTTTGIRSVLLRGLDPLFRNGAGGSVLPIKITGSRSNPSFGLELRSHDRPLHGDELSQAGRGN